MKPTRDKIRRDVWFWVGVTLLSLSALFWLIVTITFLGAPEGTGSTIGSGLALSMIPVATGLYYVVRGRSVWFWVGVALLSLSTLFWFAIVIAIFGPPEGAGSIGSGLAFSIIPVAIGLYCIIHGRRASTEKRLSDTNIDRHRKQIIESAPGERPIGFTRGTESEIVLPMPFWFKIVAWWEVVGIPLFIGGLLLIGEPEFWVIVPGFCLSLLGMWMLSMTKKVIFGQPPGYITLEWGSHRYWPFIVKTARISKEEVRTVGVHTRAARFSGFAEGWSSYQVKVTTWSGKELILHRDSEENRARYLAERIARFTQEPDEA